MELKPFILLQLVMCAIVFVEVLLNIRKTSLLKVCFLVMISSLFVMNYFSYFQVHSRLEFVLVKSMRVVYVGSTMLAIIGMGKPTIPKWIIAFISLSVFFLISLRILYFHEINIERQSILSNHIFSVGRELSEPRPYLLYTVLCLVAITAGLTFIHYRKIFLTINKDNIDHIKFSRWIISIVIPFFLLIIFGVLGQMNLFHDSVSPLLFSCFSCIIIFSILLRPRFLNNSPIY